ncbi:hypothetical protein OSL35_21905, partial [Escherichia coli]|nr:hypothetical protein [Escherichia coli]
SAQIREILISESAWEEMTCLFAPSLGLYKLTDLQQKDNLAAANPQVVKEMQGVVREFIDSSQPPLSEVNQEKFNNIKKALSEAK